MHTYGCFRAVAKAFQILLRLGVPALVYRQPGRFHRACESVLRQAGRNQHDCNRKDPKHDRWTRYNQRLFHKIIDALVAYGPYGLLVLSFIDSVGIPIATGMDALLILIAVKAPYSAPLAAAMAVVGSIGGNLILYLAARKGGRSFLAQSQKPGRAHRFRLWFERYGLITIFIPALLPIPMPLKLFVASAGALGTKMRSFLGVVALARVLRFGGDSWLGVVVGESSAGFLKTHTWHFLIAAVVLFFALYLLVRLNDHWRGRADLLNHT
jgi:membrane protein YqaA with SNARE-associated domain